MSAPARGDESELEVPGQAATSFDRAPSPPPPPEPTPCEPTPPEVLSPAVAATAGRDQRLHPFSWLFVLLNQLRQVALPLVALLVFGRGEWWELIGVVAAVAFAAHAFVVSLSFRYRLGERELVVREGLFDRTERNVPFARIQNVVQRRNLLHRLFGVTELRLESAGGAKPEAVMNVVTLAAAAELERALRDERAPRSRQPGQAGQEGLAARPGQVGEAGTAGAAGTGAAADDGRSRGDRGDLAAASPLGAGLPASHPAWAGGPAPQTLYQLSLADTIRFGLISNRGMVLVAAAIGLLFQGGGDPREMPGIRALWNLLEGHLGSFVDGHGPLELVAAALLLVGGAVLLLRLLSVAIALNTLWDFRLDLEGERLTSEHGLLTRIRAGATRAKLQLITLEEGILHRLFARQTVRVAVAAGVSGGEGDQARLRWIAPLIPRSEVPALLAAVQPGTDVAAMGWQSLHPRAFRRLAKRSLFGVAGLTALLTKLFGPPGLATLLLAVPSLLRARRFARRSGWGRDDELFAVRLGGWREVTLLVRREKIQAVRLLATPFDRRAGMARVLVDVAGANDLGAATVEVPFLGEDVARALFRDLAAAAVAGGKTELGRTELAGRLPSQAPSAN